MAIDKNYYLTLSKNNQGKYAGGPTLEIRGIIDYPYGQTYLNEAGVPGKFIAVYLSDFLKEVNDNITLDELRQLKTSVIHIKLDFVNVINRIEDIEETENKNLFRGLGVSIHLDTEKYCYIVKTTSGNKKIIQQKISTLVERYDSFKDFKSFGVQSSCTQSLNPHEHTRYTVPISYTTKNLIIIKDL